MSWKNSCIIEKTPCMSMQKTNTSGTLASHGARSMAVKSAAQPMSWAPMTTRFCAP
ncbi:MAG: hypothetical protein U1F43_15925 [Myxococcota bacterium]